MAIRDLLAKYLAILAMPVHAQQKSHARAKGAKRWAILAQVLGILGLVLTGIYFSTSLLPDWFGYLLSPLGLAAWLSLVQSQSQNREP
jgi:uncharacterized membrane protein YfcA